MSKYKEKLEKIFEENPKEFCITSFGTDGINYLLTIGEAKLLKPFLTNACVTMEKVSQDEGGEWSYDVYSIYRFTETVGWGVNKKVYEYFYKFYGTCRSHEGVEYLGWKEVKPTTKTVQVFDEA